MVSYLSVARDTEAEIEVKRSRFRCTLRRVGTEDAARAVVDGLRKEHWDARHHSSAFRLFPDVERSSDDGEPAGTAGARCRRPGSPGSGRPWRSCAGTPLSTRCSR